MIHLNLITSEGNSKGTIPSLVFNFFKKTIDWIIQVQIIQHQLYQKLLQQVHTSTSAQRQTHMRGKERDLPLFWASFLVAIWVPIWAINFHTKTDRMRKVKSNNAKNKNREQVYIFKHYMGSCIIQLKTRYYQKILQNY